MNRFKILVGFTGVLFIGIIIYSFAYLLTPRSTVILHIVPLESYLSINGGQKTLVKNNQTLTIPPGGHSLTFSKDEFDSKTIQITTKDKESVDVVSALQPLTENAKKMLLNNEADAVIQMQLGEDLTKETIQIRQDYPILKDLPIQARLYEVNYCKSVKYPDDKTKIALCAEVYHEGLQPYIEKDISDLGYNPKDYEIIYINKY